MAIFKRETCPMCHYRRNEPKPGKANQKCPKCGTTMYYSDKWYKSFTHNGKLKVEAVSSNKRFTEDALGKDKVQIRENRYFDLAASVPWSDAVKSFTLWMENNVGDRTKRMYLNSLKVLAPTFSCYTLDKITPQMVEAFKKDRLSQGREPTTINRDLATLKRLFSLAESEWITKEGQPFIEVNRIRKVRLLSEKENKRIRYLTEPEIERLLWACRCPVAYGNPRKHMITLLALETGQRKASVLSLQRGDVDFKKNLIRFRTVKGGGTGTVVPMTDRLRNALRDYLNAQKVVRPYIFPSEQVRGRQGVEGACLRSDADIGFGTALAYAGIEDFRFHDLRHTFASHFLARTGNVKALQAILGHQDFGTTMNRYAHLMTGAIEAEMKKFEGAR